MRGRNIPLWEITIQRSNELHTKLHTRFEKTGRRSIEGVRFLLLGSGLTFSTADFNECKFHRSREGNGDSLVVGASFKQCTFGRCIFGGTVYRHVDFQGCTFRRCDFGTAQFIECQFRDCFLDECTAENVSFAATEVDPTAVLTGIKSPLYNYAEPIPDGESTPAQVASEWVEVRRPLNP